MAAGELETKLYELALAAQHLLLTSELGARTAQKESKEKLRVVLASLKNSNSHITVFRERQIVRDDGTKIRFKQQLVDYCFIDEDSPDPSYYCEISAATIVDGRRGHPAPQRGDVWIRIAHAPEHEEDESGEDTDDALPPEQPPQSAEEAIENTDEDFDQMLKRMGFDPEERE